MDDGPSLCIYLIEISLAVDVFGNIAFQRFKLRNQSQFCELKLSRMTRATNFARLKWSLCSARREIHRVNG